MGEAGIEVVVPQSGEFGRDVVLHYSGDHLILHFRNHIVRLIVAKGIHISILEIEYPARHVF